MVVGDGGCSDLSQGAQLGRRLFKSNHVVFPFCLEMQRRSLGLQGKVMEDGCRQNGNRKEFVGRICSWQWALVFALLF